MSNFIYLPSGCLKSAFADFRAVLLLRNFCINKSYGAYSQYIEGHVCGISHTVTGPTHFNEAKEGEGEGEAGDITMSRDFVEDPAVAAILQSYDQREREARFKGLSEPLVIYQITPR